MQVTSTAPKSCNPGEAMELEWGKEADLASVRSRGIQLKVVGAFPLRLLPALQDPLTLSWARMLFSPLAWFSLALRCGAIT